MDCTDTMRRTRILRWASLSAALAACAAALAAVSLTGWSLFQPDTRYLIAIGRWIHRAASSDDHPSPRRAFYIYQQWPLCIAAAAIFAHVPRGGWDQVRCGGTRHGRGGDALEHAPSTAAGPGPCIWRHRRRSARP